jgi:Tfp pilus assembly protein PilW
VTPIQPYQAPRRDEQAGLVHRSSKSEGGFTLVELLISSLVFSLVVGTAVALATQIQQAYGTQLDDVVAHQEARYALDWIARDLRSAGSDPYFVIADDQQVWIDPNGGLDNDDSIRIEADIHADEGATADGPDGDNADRGEIISIELDPDTNTIVRRDHNTGDLVGVAMTEPVFTDLSFTWLDTGKNETDVSTAVAYVRVEVTARSKARNQFAASQDGFTTTVLSTEVRLRTR